MTYVVHNIEPIQGIEPGKPFRMIDFLAEVLLDDQFSGNLGAMQLSANLQSKVVGLGQTGSMTLTEEEHTALCKAIVSPTNPYRPQLARSICLFGFAVVDAQPQ